MSIYLEKRIIITALGCLFSPLISSILITVLQTALNYNYDFVLFILIPIFLGSSFFLALAVPNLDLIEENKSQRKFKSFIHPVLKSIFYFILMCGGATLSWFSFYLTPLILGSFSFFDSWFGFIIFPLIFLSIVCYYYASAMAILTFNFFGINANYHKIGIIGILALVGSIGLTFIVGSWVDFFKLELIMPLLWVSSVGYMISFELRNFKTFQILAEDETIHLK